MIRFRCKSCKESVPVAECQHSQPSADGTNWTITCRCGHTQRAFA